MEVDGLLEHALFLNLRYAVGKHAGLGRRASGALIIGKTEIAWSILGVLGELAVKNALLDQSNEREQSRFLKDVEAGIVHHLRKRLSVERLTMVVSISAQMECVPAMLAIIWPLTRRIVSLKIAKCQSHHTVHQALHSAARASTPSSRAQEERPLILSRVHWVVPKIIP